MNPLNIEALHESTVRQILEKDEAAARKAGVASFWKTFNENLEGLIPDKDFRNTVFLHAVKSLQYSTRALSESTTSAAVTAGSYNKAMLPTIITRVFPKIVATKFIATRQLDVPTQLIQTFRLKRNTDKNNVPAGTEFMDPSQYHRFTDSATQWQSNKNALDPNFSTQAISGEVVDAMDLEAGPVAAENLKFGPIYPGTFTVYLTKIANPRQRIVYATDNGAGDVTVASTLAAAVTAAGGLGGYTPAAAATSIGTLTYGVLNSTLPTLATKAAHVAAPIGWRYDFDYQYAMERNKNLSEVSFVMDKINVVAKSRKNFAQISAEAIQDLEAYSEGKLDGLKELVGGMTESMALEIDQELILAMLQAAGKNSTFDMTYPSGEFRGTQYQRNQELVHKMNFLANDMSVDFLRGEGMFAITHPHVFTVLQNTNEFRMLDLDHKAAGEGSVYADNFGKINNFTVAKAPQMPWSDTILMGFTSKDLGKAPYAYFPFVTYLTPPTVDVLSGDIFSSVVGLQQRYDHSRLLDGEYGLGKLTVQNLYSAY